MVDRQRWLFEQFAVKLADAAGMMLGAPVTAALDDGESIPEDLLTSGLTANSPTASSPADSPAVLVWEQGFDAGEGCRMVVAAPGPAWEKIGGEALKAAGVDDLDRNSVRGTYLEILSQTLSSVASEVGALLNRHVSPVDGREIQADASAVSQALRVLLNGEPVLLYVGVAASLVTVLSAAAAAAAPFGPEAAGEDPFGAGAASTPRAQDADELRSAERHEMLDSSKTWELLLDVELPVSVSFGRASVPLKDVLKLTSGSIVELNRAVSDAVELIVNNCVIARGEVVVVEGNYGVRIQQIVSARERLRTLN